MVRRYFVSIVFVSCWLALGSAGVALRGAVAQTPAKSKEAATPHSHDHAGHDHDGPAPANSPPGFPPPDAAGDHAGPTGRWPQVLLAGYCVLLVGASLMGGWLPQWLSLSHTRMQTIISFVGGLMLGIAVFHMLPHALVLLGEGGADISARWMAGGLLVMFFLLRTFHFHQHEPVGSNPGEGHAHCGHDHDHAHDDDLTQARPASPQAHRLSWLGVFLGLSLHTLIDGLALGASVEGDAAHGGAILLGIGTFLAIFLHIPLDSVSITTLMAASGYRPASRNLVNTVFALLCPLGAAAFVFGVHHYAGHQPAIIGGALAFSAGVFLCIALSDLLPEMEFHSHNRLRLSLALLLGVALAWAIGFLEPEHAHGHRHARLGSSRTVDGGS